MSNSELAVTWSWLVVAVIFYGAMIHMTWLALKPKPREGHDWFWGPDSNGWIEVKPEQNDRQQSKPTSGAG